MRLIGSRLGWAAAVATAACLAPAAYGQQVDDTQQQERLEQARSKEVQPLLQIVDEYAAGQPAPRQFPIELRTDFLKATGHKTYVPYTVSIEQRALHATSVMLYLRVVRHDDVASPSAEAAADGSAEADSPEGYAYEDLHIVDLRPPPRGQPYRISRAFAVPAGPVDVYIAVKERDVEEGPKTSVLRQTIDVPDFFDGRLTTSSLILAERLDQLTEPLPADAQVMRPYALGSLEVAPAWSNEFPKSEALSLFFVIYNPEVSPETNKPDVVVDYDFYQCAGDTETFFNKTNPQLFDAQTLPPRFDLALGHQLVAGQTIPLSVFPLGQFRMNVTITDKTSGQSLMRDVRFVVRGS